MQKLAVVPDQDHAALGIGDWDQQVQRAGARSASVFSATCGAGRSKRAGGASIWTGEGDEGSEALARWMSDLGEEREPTMQATEQRHALTMPRQGEAADRGKKLSRGRPARTFCGQVLGRPTARSLVLWAGTEDRRPPQSGFLALDLTGDYHRLKRREDALRRVRDASGPMPQIGLLIDGAPGRSGAGPRRRRCPPAC